MNINYTEMIFELFSLSMLRVSATLSCPMKLHKYPLDSQTCPMMFESCTFIFSTFLCFYGIM